jgi:hypothetical protein
MTIRYRSPLTTAMSSCSKYRRLSPAQKRLLIRAAVTLGVVRLLLWILPYGHVQGLLARSTSARASAWGTFATPTEIVHATRRAARIVPFATCLVQAHAAAWLIGRTGEPAQIRFGVRRTASGISAHAWLESKGRALLDVEHADRYAPMHAALPRS